MWTVTTVGKSCSFLLLRCVDRPPGHASFACGIASSRVGSIIVRLLVSKPRRSSISDPWRLVSFSLEFLFGRAPPHTCCQVVVISSRLLALVGCRLPWPRRKRSVGLTMERKSAQRYHDSRCWRCFVPYPSWSWRAAPWAYSGISWTVGYVPAIAGGAA